MKKLLDITEHLYAPAIARKVAAELQAMDPAWQYIVQDDPHGTGSSYIAVYDEDGQFVTKY